jgi:tetratricopeptide (TPR) repeat protein
MYVFARNYDEAVRHFRRVLEMDPDNSLALYNLGLAYELKGDYDNAAAQYQRARQSDSNPTNSAEVLAQLYARMGRTVEAEKLLRELETPSKHRNPSPFSIALVYSALGRKEQAISWLDKAIADGSVQLVSLRYDPRLDKLRGDPLYSDLLRRHELSEMVPVASPLTARVHRNQVVV